MFAAAVPTRFAATAAAAVYVSTRGPSAVACSGLLHGRDHLPGVWGQVGALSLLLPKRGTCFILHVTLPKSCLIRIIALPPPPPHPHPPRHTISGILPLLFKVQFACLKPDLFRSWCERRGAGRLQSGWYVTAGAGVVTGTSGLGRCQLVKLSTHVSAAAAPSALCTPGSLPVPHPSWCCPSACPPAAAAAAAAGGAVFRARHHRSRLAPA